jgi:predicted dehydrogenase
MTEGFGFNMAYTVNFERATADYDIARGTDALKLYEEGKEAQIIRCEGGDGYVGELKHLVEAITSGKAPTVVTAQDGMTAVEICEAEERSIKSGTKVAV